MTDIPAGRRPPANDPAASRTVEARPVSVPDLMDIDEGSPMTVTDEDRTRYGVLLDRAAERGLLAPYDYEIRLRDLASATTVDQMNQIVTELPAFTSTASARPPKKSRWANPGVEPDRPLVAPTGGRRSPNPWLMLAILVIITVVSLVLLAAYAQHMVRSHHSGLRSPPAATRSLSGLRL